MKVEGAKVSDVGLFDQNTPDMESAVNLAERLAKIGRKRPEK